MANLDARYLLKASNLSDLASAATARTNMGVAIGSNVQAWDAQLDDLAGLAFTKGNVIVSDGSNWLALGIGSNDDVLTADSAQGSGVKWAAPAGGSNWSVASNVMQPAVDGDGVLIDVPTTNREALVLQTTDDNTTKNLLELRDSGGNALIFGTADGKLGLGVAPTEKAEVNYGHLRFNQESRPGTCVDDVNPAAGNLNGTYYYRISFVTADGETEIGPVSGGVGPSNEQVDLSSIDTGGSNVTARKIYRTVAGGNWSLPFYLVDTINDNTTTTYTDNVADGSLGAQGKFLNTTGGLLKIGTAVILNASEEFTGIGLNAGAVNSGGENTFIGINAGQSNLEGFGNTFIGENAGQGNTTTDETVAIGAFAGETGGSVDSVMIGYKAGQTAANIGLVLIGWQSGANLTGNAARITFIGYGAGAANTDGSGNTFLGYEAGVDTTTGDDNTFLGNYAGRANITNSHNVMVGRGAGQNSKVNYSTLVGVNAGNKQTTGSNVCIGYSANYNNQTGLANVIIGSWAGEGTGLHNKSRNVMIGVQAGKNTLAADNNILIGFNAGDVITTGDDNIIIGYDIDPSGATVSDELNIGGLLMGYLAAHGSGPAINLLGGTPQAQQAHIVDADGTLADITAKFNTLLADLEGFGFLATV